MSPASISLMFADSATTPQAISLSGRKPNATPSYMSVAPLENLSIASEYASPFELSNRESRKTQSSGLTPAIDGKTYDPNDAAHAREKPTQPTVGVIPSGQLAAIVAKNAGSSWSDGIELSARLDAVLNAARSRADVHLVADPVLFLGDGRQAEFERVESIPFEQTISRLTNAAVIRDTSIEFLPVGFSAQVSLRETASESAMVELTIENSSIKALNDNLPPTTSRDRFTSALPINAGGVYLVGAFEVTESKRDKAMGFRRLNAWSHERRIYQVWLRSYQVEGGTIKRRTTQPEQGGRALIGWDSAQDEKSNLYR